MAGVRSPQIIVSINILYFTNTCEWWVSTISLECDNSLITVHSANTVQAERLVQEGRCARQQWDNAG